MIKTVLLKWIFRVLMMSQISSMEAAVISIGGSNIVLRERQPVQVVVVDNSGNTNQQTVYYDPAIGGVDLDTEWAGPNASIYFPAYGTRYLSYNGCWVDQEGYCWRGGARVCIGHPGWRDHWDHHWGHHGHDDWHGSHKTSVHIHEKNVYHNDGHHHHH